MRPGIRTTADGLFRPQLNYDEGPKRYGAKVALILAVKRARAAFDAHRRRVLVCKGMMAERDERMRELERRRPLRAMFA